MKFYLNTKKNRFFQTIKNLNSFTIKLFEINLCQKTQHIERHSIEEYSSKYELGIEIEQKKFDELFANYNCMCI